MKIDITVLTKHVQTGSPKNAFCCPIAKALSESFPEKTFRVAKDHVVCYTAKGNQTAELPEAAKLFVKAFDQKEPVEVPLAISLLFNPIEKSTRKRV